jgi:hypothetical protein
MVLTARTVTAKKLHDPTCSLAVTKWLALFDADDFAGARNASHSRFKATYTEEAFVGSQQQQRIANGRLVAREVTGVAYYPADPGGELAIFMYKTKYEKRKALETIRCVRDIDQQWRVENYAFRLP